MNITDETLAAYADGELDGAEKERVAAAVAADPALAAKIEAHHALKARLAAHYAPLAEQAAPPHLAALFSGAQDKDEQKKGEQVGHEDHIFGDRPNQGQAVEVVGLVSRGDVHIKLQLSLICHVQVNGEHEEEDGERH